MKKITAVILDDETSGREVLRHLLSTHCPDVEIAMITNTIAEAKRGLELLKPDILFLDVRINKHIGFDLLQLTDYKPFVVVTTAHSEYAIRALREECVDYLLKPIVGEELKAAVEKIKEKKKEKKTTEPALATNSIFIRNGRIAIPSSEGLLFIALKDIIRCEASGAYTEVFTKMSKLITCVNLGEFEKLLQGESGFFRVHHSSIINLSEVTLYVRGEGGYAVMSDNSHVTISKRKKGFFLDRIKNQMPVLNGTFPGITAT